MMKKIKITLQKALKRNLPNTDEMLVDDLCYEINDGSFNDNFFFNPQRTKDIGAYNEPIINELLRLHLSSTKTNNLSEYLNSLTVYFPNTPQSWLLRWVKGVEGISVFDQFGQNFVELGSIYNNNFSDIHTPDEKKIQELTLKIWKSDLKSLPLNEIDNLINDIINGRIQTYNDRRIRRIAEQLPEDANGGRLLRCYNKSRSKSNALIAAAICGGSSGGVDSSTLFYKRELVLQQWAKHSKCWIDNIDEYARQHSWRRAPELDGTESMIYTTPNGFVAKIWCMEKYHENLRLATEKIILNNFFFGDETFLNVIGFTSVNHRLRFVLLQPKIKHIKENNNYNGIAIRKYLENSKKTLSGISGIKHKTTNTTVSPIIIAEAKLAKLMLPIMSKLEVDNDVYYGGNMMFEMSCKKDAVNIPFMLANDFFKKHPECKPIKFRFDIEDIKIQPDVFQTLLKDAAELYYTLFPKGVMDMYIRVLGGNKVIATTKYKSTKYRPYEYIQITDLKTLGVSSLSELAVTNINALFDLFRKGRELLFSGEYTGKKSDKRIGVDWLKGEDANCQMLSESFGLRSIIYGTTKSKEMPIVNNNAYNAFMDLKLICGFKSPLLVSHKGSLTLNFGAKKLGDYAAYYRPANKSLNLTRTEGSGSFAHEWFHSLDNYLGILYNIRLCPEYNSSFISWCSELSAPYNVRNKKLIDIAYQWGKDMRKLSLYEPSAEADRRKKRRYWSTPHEVSARCFSYYVLRKLAAKGYSNDYLVDIRTSKFYPQPVDEAIIMKFFDNFFKALQTDFDKDNNMPYLYGAEPDIPEIENAVSAEKMAQIPQTEAGRRTFLDNELQRYKGTEVYSRYFNQNVKILGKSINEICKWAAIREASVIAALNIDGVIANATYVNESEPHNNTQKKKFRAIKMYELHCVIKGFGTAKLMVAEQVTGTKITYCITEMQI